MSAALPHRFLILRQYSLSSFDRFAVLQHKSSNYTHRVSNAVSAPLAANAVKNEVAQFHWTAEFELYASTPRYRQP